MIKPPCGSARPAQHAADLPTHGGGAEHPATRKHRALAPIRALAARREISGRGMETTDSQRLTVTPASSEGRAPCRSPKPKRRGGPACLADEAAARTAAQGAVPGTVPDRPWPRPLRIEA